MRNHHHYDIPSYANDDSPNAAADSSPAAASTRTRKRRIPTGLQLPAPSMSLESLQKDKAAQDLVKTQKGVSIRCVSAECSICLNPYTVGDKVSWSALDCSHAFHQTCIVEWLMTLGKKANSEVVRLGGMEVRQNDLCTFKMVCPICRQDFIAKNK